MGSACAESKIYCWRKAKGKNKFNEIKGNLSLDLGGTEINSITNFDDDLNGRPTKLKIKKTT